MHSRPSSQFIPIFGKGDFFPLVYKYIGGRLFVQAPCPTLICNACVGIHLRGAYHRRPEGATQ
jgi:hypothetical protein